MQHSLHLRAVLAHNVGVVTAGIVQPFAGKVYLISEQGTLQGTKGAKSIGAEQGTGGGVIGHQHFRPVYHGRGHKDAGCAARCRVSPSFTTLMRPSSYPGSVGKYIFSMGSGVHHHGVSGCRTSRSDMAAWSGSMCCTTR